MNNRLSIHDLSIILAEYSGKEQNECEKFLHELITVISEGVLTDRLVKVKGIGTFKIILAEKRESIHVNTGERFTIPAHYKFSFLPDKELREAVNKPFAFFETAELKDNVNFIDLEVSPEPEEEKEKEILPSEPEQPTEETPVETPPTPEEPKIAPKPLPTQKNKKWTSGYVTMLLILFLICIAAGACYLIYTNQALFVGVSSNKTTVLTESSLPQIEDVPPITDTTANKESDTPSDNVSESAQEVSSVAETPKQAVTASKPTDKVLAKVKIKAGSRLTLIALEHYGHKIFWVYIYEFNKKNIANPNNIPIGTIIEVPAPELYGIDKNSRASLSKAAERQTEILSGK